MHKSIIVLTLLFASIILTGTFASCEEKQSYASVEGNVVNEWRRPAGGVAVTLTSQTNGYSTNNPIAMSDVNGHYKITNVPRYIYSSGPEPKVVDYYLTVNNPGYEQYSGDTFNFKDSTSAKQDIRLKSIKVQ